MPKGDKATTTNALDILHQRYYANRPERLGDLQNARENAHASRQLRRLRLEQGLTQQELADRIGTSASQISRLENDDYDGHTLDSVRRIANALGHDLTMGFIPRDPYSPEETAAALHSDSPEEHEDQEDRIHSVQTA